MGISIIFIIVLDTSSSLLLMSSLLLLSLLLSVLSIIIIVVVVAMVTGIHDVGVVNTCAAEVEELESAVVRESSRGHVLIHGGGVARGYDRSTECSACTSRIEVGCAVGVLSVATT